MRLEGSQGERGINGPGLSARLCRESPLTPWKLPTLAEVAGDGFVSPATATWRMRGLGQRPRVCARCAALACYAAAAAVLEALLGEAARDGSAASGIAGIGRGLRRVAPSRTMR